MKKIDEGMPIDTPAPIVSYTLGLDWLKYRKRTWLTAFLTLCWPVWSTISTFFQNSETLPARVAGLAKHSPLIDHFVYDEKVQKAWISGLYEHMLYGGQAVIIFILLLLSCECLKNRPYYDREEEKNAIATIAARRFYLRWIGLLVSWLALYATRCFYADPGHTSVMLQNKGIEQADNIFHAVFDLLNNLEAVFLFAAYFEMAAITIDDDGKANRKTQFVQYFSVLGSFVLITCLGFVCPGQGWHILSGLLVGVSMALLIGRFTSLYIGTPLLFVVLLYFYAVIQAAYPGVFYAPDMMNKIMNMILAPLKIVMFVVVDWIYFSGKLVFYMGKERRLLKQVKDDWILYCKDFTPLKQTEKTA